MSVKINTQNTDRTSPSDSRYAFIRLRVTGVRPTTDRIRGIDLVLKDGDQVVSEWSVEIPVPNLAPAEANPAFAKIASQLLVRLTGRVLVGRNMRFVSAMLRNELKRIGSDQRFKVICLSRLINVFSLRKEGHLRASQLTAQDLLMELEWIKKEVGHDRFEEALVEQLRYQSLPPNIALQDIQRLPDSPGVYYFYGDQRRLLYVGKSIQIRTRVLSHFSDDHRENREMEMSRQVCSIEFTECAGELSALLLEAQHVKQLRPLYNRRLRRLNQLYSVCWTGEPSHAPETVILSTDQPLKSEHLFGLFRNRINAEQALRKLSDKYALCLKVLGLERGKGSCFGYQLGRCHGACINQETRVAHAQRLRVALERLKVQAWPFPDTVVLTETNVKNGRSQSHLIQQWCYLGDVSQPSSLESIVFDLDIYRLLNQYLKGQTVFSRWEKKGFQYHLTLSNSK
ncbi:hypothetical protein [Nitrincola nitratireducens]|uniref:Excinuclease cho n=1 Tax=Nitrincola nitratireducens TaxID=1229521 RepID=W9UZW8_9GAMM|nr:hypothetical protein [Nitrincola nitratireducens]EXJ12793.1 Excinuclease cho [Nitrincola nitratireducens]